MDGWSRSESRITIHESRHDSQVTNHVVRGLNVARSSTVRRLRPIADLQFVIITGLSGAGKSNAMKVFEDLGFFCVDNLPPALLPKFAELCLQSEGRVQRAALAIDARGGEFFNDLFTSLNALERSEEHTSELQSQSNLVCRLLLEKKKNANAKYAGCTLDVNAPNQDAR